jgi:hypothetical protein
MRALGPGSVSSVLKTALDVVFWALIIGASISFVAVAVALAFGGGNVRFQAPGLTLNSSEHLPIVAGGLVVALLTVGGLLIIMQALRRVFHTLTIGEPFQHANVTRLRVIGFALAALEAISYVARIGLGSALPAEADRIDWWPNFTAWFAVLVVFVLAEVFREGTRLRREADLTI